MIPHSRPSIGPTELEAVLARLESGMIAEGATVAELEAALARRYGFAAAVATGSGCQALLLALKLLNAGPAARVVLPAYVCPEVLGVVETLGAEAVLADSGQDALIDPDDPALRAVSAAVILPYLFGRVPSNYRAPGVVPWDRVILDWAQYAPAAPAVVPAEARIAILSFEATKVLTGGEGGAILLRDPTDATRVRAMKSLPGTDLKLNLYPLSDLQAALALAQLRRLGELLARRGALAAKYDVAFQGLTSARIMPRNPAESPFRYLLELTSGAGQAGRVIAAFAARGVTVRRPVAPPAHHVRPSGRRFPVADRLYDTLISLPLYPALTGDQAARVITAAQEILG